MKSLLVIFLLVAGSAYAEPPAGSDPDSEIAHWFQGLTTASGSSCCSISDCRTVLYHTVGNLFEAFIDKKTFGPSAPDRFVPVPATAILRLANPTGEGVACFSRGEIICFVQGRAI